MAACSGIAAPAARPLIVDARHWRGAGYAAAVPLISSTELRYSRAHVRQAFPFLARLFGGVSPCAPPRGASGSAALLGLALGADHSAGALVMLRLGLAARFDPLLAAGAVWWWWREAASWVPESVWPCDAGFPCRGWPRASAYRFPAARGTAALVALSSGCRTPPGCAGVSLLALALMLAACAGPTPGLGHQRMTTASLLAPCAVAFARQSQLGPDPAVRAGLVIG